MKLSAKKVKLKRLHVKSYYIDAYRVRYLDKPEKSTHYKSRDKNSTRPAWQCIAWQLAVWRAGGKEEVQPEIDEINRQEGFEMQMRHHGIDALKNVFDVDSEMASRAPRLFSDYSSANHDESLDEDGQSWAAAFGAVSTNKSAEESLEEIFETQIKHYGVEGLKNMFDAESHMAEMPSSGAARGSIISVSTEDSDVDASDENANNGNGRSWARAFGASRVVGAMRSVHRHGK